MKKVIKTEITDCRHCPYSRWDDGKHCWQLLCMKFNGFIKKEGQKYPPPSTCQLDDAERLEQLSALQGCYIIRSEDIEAILSTRTVDQLNDTEFLKKIIDVLEKRYFKLKDQNDGLEIQIKLEDNDDIEKV